MGWNPVCNRGAAVEADAIGRAAVEADAIWEQQSKRTRSGAAADHESGEQQSSLKRAQSGSSIWRRRQTGSQQWKRMLQSGLGAAAGGGGKWGASSGSGCRNRAREQQLKRTQSGRSRKLSGAGLRTVGEQGGSSWASEASSATCKYIVITSAYVVDGRTYFGVKWQILPLCIKGKFYAIHVFVHKGKILRHGCRYVHNDSILRHGVWRKIPLWNGMTTNTMLSIHKGKILRQWTKRTGLPLIDLMDRAHPIQDHGINGVKFSLCVA